MGSNTKTGADATTARPSKTKLKQSAHAAQRVGEVLSTLSDAQLSAIEMPAELREAVVALRRMRQHGARRRQMQYIGALMRNIDAKRLQEQIDQARSEDDQERRRFKQVEGWRDELAAGDERRLAWLTATYPHLDSGHLARLTEAVTGAKADPERKKAGRALFKYLRSLVS